MTISPTVDRRSLLKSRHRAAILTAARELVSERGGPRFSVDELADRADVARRTVFNHFASVDEVLLTLCDEVLNILIDDFVAMVAAAPIGDRTRASMFDEIVDTFRTADLPLAISTIVQILGAPDSDAASEQRLANAAFARLGDRLVEEVQRRNADIDPLDAELLVSSLMSGVVVISKHWIARTGAAIDKAARAEWQRLLTKLIDSIRSGYLPTS
ncbi:hypothetical protein BH09ACT1_BH09ACT1_22280 [soil metagenome]